ncbi:hypothetical protein V490_01358 [Pseudogymnoascus sp. VKM F-3557]|nr:hypothetical protein V490_01358 [Pseudogymnoascus sp. VKM F-3557]
MGDRQTLPVRYRLAYGEGLLENRNGLSPRNRGSTGILASIIGRSFKGCSQIAGNLCTEVPVVLGRAVHNKDGVGVGVGVGAGVGAGVGVGVKNAPKPQSGIWGRPISLALSESDSASPPAPD